MSAHITSVYMFVQSKCGGVWGGGGGTSPLQLLVSDYACFSCCSLCSSTQGGPKQCVMGCDSRLTFCIAC